MVVSEVSPSSQLLFQTDQEHDCRDTSMPNDLDGPGGLRSQQLTEYLTNTWSSTELWNNYGIDDDVIVSLVLLFVCPT